jgi:hypothetical protein
MCYGVIASFGPSCFGVTVWCYGLREGWAEAVLRCYGVMGAKQAGEIIQIVQNGQIFLRGATPRPQTNKNVGIFSGRVGHICPVLWRYGRFVDVLWRYGVMGLY